MIHVVSIPLGLPIELLTSGQGGLTVGFGSTTFGCRAIYINRHNEYGVCLSCPIGTEGLICAHKHKPRVTFLGPVKILKNSVPNVPLLGVPGCETRFDETGWPADAGGAGEERLAWVGTAMRDQECGRHMVS